MSGRRQWIIFGMYFAASVAGGAMLARCVMAQNGLSSRPGVPDFGVVVGDEPRAPVDPLQQGLALFAENCAMCHGDKGRGDGPAKSALFPLARDFASGQFRNTTTVRGLPREEDLMRTIRTGMLPSPMPPWSKFTDDQLRALARAIGHLALEGRVSDRMAEEPRLTREKALQIAHEALDSGERIKLPDRPEAIALERGKAFFKTNCAVCHDENGKARNRTDLRDSIGQPMRPRNLTTGPYRGGFEMEDIATRILRGIPGTPMPSFAKISAEDLWATVAYVRSLKTADPPPSQGCPSGRR